MSVTASAAVARRRWRQRLHEDRDESARLVESRVLRVRVLEDAIERELVRAMVAELERAGGVGGCQRS